MQVGGQFRALVDDAMGRLVLRQIDGPVEKRLVGDGAPRLQPAGGREDDLGLCIVDAGGEFCGGKPAEDHGMDRADTRAGKHGKDRLRDHRHVDDDPVAFHNAQILKDGGKGRDLFFELIVGVMLDRAGHGAVVDHRILIASTTRDVAVNGVVTGVADPVGEPLAVDAGAVVKHGLRFREPVDVPGGCAPETCGVVLPGIIGVLVGGCHLSGPLCVNLRPLCHKARSVKMRQCVVYHGMRNGREARRLSGEDPVLHVGRPPRSGRINPL